MTSGNGLESFVGYQKALRLFDEVVQDCGTHMREQECKRLVAQQLASADSISSNIEEGYGRLSNREYVQFLVYARGSAQETRGRYRRFKHWIPEDIVGERVALLGEIIAILTATIGTLRGKRT